MKYGSLTPQPPNWLIFQSKIETIVIPYSVLEISCTCYATYIRMYNKYLLSQNNIRTIYAANEHGYIENETIHILVCMYILYYWMDACTQTYLFIF